MAHPNLRLNDGGLRGCAQLIFSNTVGTFDNAQTAFNHIQHAQIGDDAVSYTHLTLPTIYSV